MLMDRCTSRETFDALVDLVNDFKAYFVRKRRSARLSGLSSTISTSSPGLTISP